MPLIDRRRSARIVTMLQTIVSREIKRDPAVFTVGQFSEHDELL